MDKWLDINECNANNGGCEQDCYNTAGSYNCTCDTGYILELNNHNCKGNDSNISNYNYLYIFNYQTWMNVLLV